MDLTLIIGLVVLGIVLLLLELLVIPGVGIVGIGGFALLGLSVWRVYTEFGTTAGHLFFAGIGILLIFFLWWALRTKTWKHAALKAEIDGKSDGQPDTKIQIGDQGVTTSRLNPSGKALINEDFFEVRTYDKLINNNVKIEVTKIDNRTIYVKEIAE